jgi:transcriptional regulator GlxA family with amidase domain
MSDSNTTLSQPSIRVGIVIFDDVEVLDFAGPYEVFSVADRHNPNKPFDVRLVAQVRRTIVARNRFEVQAQESFESCPPLTGSRGRRRRLPRRRLRLWHALEKKNPVLLEWLRRRAATAQHMLSVCSGALVLANAGLLDDLRATTHRGAYQELRNTNRGIEVVEDVKMVDSGFVVTSGRISAGIDMSLGMVVKCLGLRAAIDTAEYLEYDWRPTKRTVEG